MRKFSIVILLIVVLLALNLIIVLIKTTGNSRKQYALEENNMIFTALPKRNNTYYNVFYKDLTSFNENFNNTLGHNDSLKVITTNKIKQKTADFIYDDIWVRDVAPVVTTRLVKFKYSPEYLDATVSDELDTQFRRWLDSNQFNYYQSSLILDGGNCVWDKKETVIVTDRILSDNNYLSREEIVAQLKKDLQVTKVIIIPTEEGDSLSHSDGMVKFIGQNTLFISDFLGDTKFKQVVERIILKTLPKINIVEMASSYVEEGQYDKEIASAKGLYINMLETEKNIYVPQFDLPEDANQIEFIKQYTNKKVIPVSVNEISTMGGAINCLTWYCPEELLPNFI